MSPRPHARWDAAGELLAARGYDLATAEIGVAVPGRS